MIDVVVFFFLLGVFARLVGSDLRLPEALIEAVRAARAAVPLYRDVSTIVFERARSAARNRAEDLKPTTRQTTPYHRAHIDHTASASPHGWQRFYRPPAIPNRRRETSCRLVSC